MALRCLLVSVNTVDTPYPAYPLGIAHIAGALKSKGHDVRQLDALSCEGSYLDDLSRLIVDFQPRFIGISIRNLDLEDSSSPHSFIWDIQNTVSVIRKVSSVPIVLGGPGFSLLPEVILAFLNADYGIVGEGEQAIVNLAAALEADNPPLEKIIRASVLDYPWQTVEYDRSIVPYYLKKCGIINIQSKRGCPYKCSYCGYPQLEGCRIRSRDPDEVAEEAVRLKTDFDARYLFFTDSVFNDPDGHYLELCESLIRQGNTLPWSGYFRPANIKREDLQLLKKAGLDTMEVGTDAGCDQTLEGLNKKFTFDSVLELNRVAAALEIPCAHFIMFGSPGETPATLDESLKNIDKLRLAVVFAFSGIRILPQTTLRELAVKENVIDEKDDLLTPRFYFSPQISREHLNKVLIEQFKTRFDRIYPCTEIIGRIQQFHNKGFTGPIWDKIIRMGMSQ